MRLLQQISTWVHCYLVTTMVPGDQCQHTVQSYLNKPLGLRQMTCSLITFKCAKHNLLLHLISTTTKANKVIDYNQQTMLNET